MKIGVLALLHLLAPTEGSPDDATTAARIAKSVLDWYGLTCVVLFRDSTADDTHEAFRVLKVMLAAAKAVAVREMKSHWESVPYRYDRRRCPEMLHLLYGSYSSRTKLEQLSHLVGLSGPVWVAFVPGNMSVEGYLRSVDVPFNANFIAVQDSGRMFVLRHAYRVSMSHPIRTVSFGSWTPDGGLVVQDGYSPYWHRSNMEGKVFRVSAIENWPISFMTNSGSIGGYFGEVWSDLEERLNFSTVYIEPKDKATGVWDGRRWSGLVGMVVRGEIDATVSEVTMTPDRLPVVEFLKPLFTTRYQLFFKAPGITIEWDLILRPFRTEVWVTLLIWLSVLTVLLVGGYRIGLRYGLEDPRYTPEFKDHHCLFFIVSAFVQQGSTHLPTSSFCRLTLATAYMFSSIIVIIYSCTLTSMIAVERFSRPFNSLESFLRDGTYTLEQIPGTDSYAYFSNSTDAVLRQIYEEKFSRLPDEDLPKSHRDALGRVCTEEKVAHLGEFAVAVIAAEQLSVTKGCPILYLERPLKLLYLTMAVGKDSPYRDAFDYQLGQMAVTGILNRLRYGSFPLAGGSRKGTQHRPVASEQVAQVNAVVAVGVVASVCILLAEALARPRGPRPGAVSAGGGRRRLYPSRQTNGR